MVVLAIRANLGEADIDRHLARIAEVRSQSLGSLANFKKIMIGSLTDPPFDINDWAARQVYIALGQFMAAAAIMGVDTCPMEGIDPDKYDEELGIAAQGYRTVVGCAAGYRLAGRQVRTAPKCDSKPKTSCSECEGTSVRGAGFQPDFWAGRLEAYPTGKIRGHIMQQRKLGNQGLTVSALGLGCMGMTWAYGTDRDETESIATIHEAIDFGVNFFDTAEVYGPFTNEVLFGKALKGRRDKVVIATKFGFVFNEAGQITGADSRPEHIRERRELFAQAAGDRLHRLALSASRRSQRADRGRRRRHGRARAGRQGARISASPKRGQARSAGR